MSKISETIHARAIEHMAKNGMLDSAMNYSRAVDAVLDRDKDLLTAHHSLRVGKPVASKHTAQVSAAVEIVTQRYQADHPEVKDFARAMQFALQLPENRTLAKQYAGTV